jgi:hypothetical protein
MVSAVSHRARYKDDGHRKRKSRIPSPDPPDVETIESDTNAALLRHELGEQTMEVVDAGLTDG